MQTEAKTPGSSRSQMSAERSGPEPAAVKRLFGEAEFEPHGLPGYRVFRSASWRGSRFGDWFFQLPPDVPSAFEWNETAQDHTIPVCRDWAIGPRKTAKSIVAAAHEHDRWARAKLAEIRASAQSMPFDAQPTPRLHPCASCAEPHTLSDLNSDMLCIECGEPDENEDDFIDLSDAAQRREHGTYL